MPELELTGGIKMTDAELLKACGIDKLPKFPLRPRQKEAIAVVIDGRGFIVCLPTGYGKTIAAIAIIKKAIAEGGTAILLSSNKSLTREQIETFTQWGIDCDIDDGDNRKDRSYYEKNGFSPLMVMTYERFESVVSSDLREVIMENCKVVVVDEFHTLGDEERGANLEDAIVLARFFCPDITVCGLSATIGEVSRQKLADWLDVALIYANPKTERPVPLDLHYRNYEEVMFPWNDEIPDMRANYQIRLDIARDIIAEHPGKRFLIFTTSRPRTESVARDLTGSRQHLELMDLVEQFKIGFHNAGLEVEERHYVEDGFRNGEITMVVATPTLAVGVNLPADVCIVFDVEQYSAVKGSEIIDANRLQQTIGRAGRPGLSEIGYAYVIVPNRIYGEVKRRCETPLEVESKIKKRLHEKVLRWINCGAVQDEADLLEVIRYAYGDISAKDAIKAINWLKAFRFVTEEDGIYQISEIGQATAKQMIQPETVVDWTVQLQNVVNPNSVIENYIRFGAVPEYYNVVVIRKEDEKTIEIGQHELGPNFPQMREPCKGYLCHYCDMQNDCDTKKADTTECDGFRPIEYVIPQELYKAFFITFADELKEKYGMIQKKVVNGKTVIKDTRIVSGGDKVLLRNAGERMFNAASYIFKHEGAISKTLGTIADLCSAGTFRPELVDLMKLKKIGLIRAKALFQSGIKTQGEFLNLDPKQLSGIMSKSGTRMSPRVAEAILRLNQGNKVTLGDLSEKEDDLDEEKPAKENQD